MFCNKCGAILPDDSEFCSKCGNTLEKKVSLEKNLPEVMVPHESRPQAMGMVCRNCSKPLTTKWRKCPYCDTPNPFYIPPEPEPPKTPEQPAQPQIIIHEREIIKKDNDSDGCALTVGKIVLGIVEFAFFCWLLSQCSGG